MQEARRYSAAIWFIIGARSVMSLTVGPRLRHVVERGHLVRGDLFEHGAGLDQIRLVAQHLEELRRRLHVLGRRCDRRRLKPACAKLLW